MKIRQEINILTAAPISTTSDTLNAHVLLDTTKYDGTVKYYFEIVGNIATSTTNLTVSLRRKGTSTDDASIIMSSSYTSFPNTHLMRSNEFTPPSGQTEYVVFLSGSPASLTIEKARIVIVQDNPTKTESQFEMGAQEFPKNNTAPAMPATYPVYWKYTAANWDPAPSFFAEACYKNIQVVQEFTSGTTWACPTGVTSIKVECIGGGGAGGGGTNTGTPGGSGGGGGAYAARNTVSVTPANVYTYAVGAAGTGGTGAGGNGGDSSFTGDGGVQVIAKGGLGGAINGGTAGTGGLASASTGDVKYDGGDGFAGAGTVGGGGGAGANSTSNGTDATGQSGAVPSGDGAAGGGGGDLGVNGTNGSNYGGAGGGGGRRSGGSESGGNGGSGVVRITYSYPLTVVLQEADGTGDGFTGWSTKATIVNATTSTTPTRSRVSFTPTSGRNYRLGAFIGNSGGTYVVYNGKIVAQISSGLNKLESEYYLSSTIPNTGRDNRRSTRWNSAEWDANCTYKLKVDSNDNSTCVVGLYFGDRGVDYKTAATEHTNDMRGVQFSSDGLKMYVSSLNDGNLYYYNLTTAWDPSTASYVGARDLSAENSNIIHFVFKPDGTKLYTHEYTANDIHEYNLSTAWDVTTTSFVQTKNIAANPTGGANSIYFKSDGTKMYIGGWSAGTIYQYSLSSAWNISTLSYDSVSYTTIANAGSWTMSSDGSKLYLTYDQGSGVYRSIKQYTLTTPWSLSSVTDDGTLDFGLNSPIYGMCLSADDTYLYIQNKLGTVTRMPFGKARDFNTLNLLRNSVLSSPDNSGTTTIELPTTGGNTPYLYDTYTGAGPGYSLRKLRSAQTNCIRVRRSSDNAEQDIGFSGEHLDIASLTSFVGANDGCVVTWYDQSGNGINATNSTTTQQPVIVKAGAVYYYHGRPAMKTTDGTSRHLTTTSATNIWSDSSGQWQCYGVGMTTIGGTKLLWSVDPSGDRFRVNFHFSGGNFCTWSATGGYDYISNQAASQDHWLMNDIRRKSTRNESVEVWVNGWSNVRTVVTGTPTQNSRLSRIGDYQISGGFNWAGYVQELIMWPDADSSRMLDVRCNMNNYWNVYEDLSVNVVSSAAGVYSTKIIVEASKRSNPRVFGFVNGS